MCTHMYRYVHTGAHEPLKAAKERRTQHAGRSGSSITSHVPNVYLIVLRKSVKAKWHLFGTAKVFHIRYDRKA